MKKDHYDFSFNFEESVSLLDAICLKLDLINSEISSTLAGADRFAKDVFDHMGRMKETPYSAQEWDEIVARIQEEALRDKLTEGGNYGALGKKIFSKLLKQDDIFENDEESAIFADMFARYSAASRLTDSGKLNRTKEVIR